MTQREFFEKVIATSTEAEIVKKAKELVEALNRKNAQRAAKPSKIQIENEAIKAEILEYLAGGKVQTAPEIGVGLGISTQKASALAKQLAEIGKVVQSEIKVPKKGKLKAYSLATDEVSE